MADEAALEAWRKVTEVLIGSWPGLVAQWGIDAIEAYVKEVAVRGAEPAEVIRALRAHKGEFPPSAGSVIAIVERQRQGPAPDYMTAMRFIASKVTLLDYRKPAKTFDKFVARLAEEHEAIARFALEMGPQGVREMPDPRMAQDVGGSTAITRNERSYRRTTAEWEEDPSPGLALAEAKRIAIAAGSGDDRRQLGSGGMRDAVEGMRPNAGELEAGDDDGA